MRLRRTLSGLVGAALIGAASLSLTTTADAAEAEAVELTAVSTAEGDLPRRKVSSKIIETKRNKLIFKGNVSPGHALKPVFIQKRNCLKRACDWHMFNKVITNKSGGFRSRVTAPRKGYDYWRAKVRAHGGYGTSYSEVWRTYIV